MALFQKAPSTQAEVDRGKPLDISPDEVLEMDEDEWYEKVYRGDEIPQLTLRAVLMGSFLGLFLAATNLYIGLKTGWGLGVAITACILSFAIWNVLLRLRLARTPMTILENNCMQSTASAAGYATGGTMVSAIPALLMLSATLDNPKGIHVPWYVLLLWTFFLAVLGTLMAIPMKRNMINREKLKFPSGTAAAATLQSLYSEGAEATRKARALLYSAVGGLVVSVSLDLQFLSKKVVDKATGAVSWANHALLPGDSKLFDWLPSSSHVQADGTTTVYKPSDWTMVMDHNPVMIAAGMLVGLRVTIYMMFGALLLVYGVGPEAYDYVWTSTATGEPLRAATAPFKAWKEIGIWLGVPIMVAYGLLSFAFQWRTIARAFKGLTGGNSTESDLITRTEVPTSWFLWGTLFAGAGTVWVAQAYFFVPWYFGCLAVSLTFFLALVACRATGESDITPTGAMGKIMQLTYGVLIPQSTTANLMTAGITASSAGSSADLLNDLKSGYLLGANPRRQFIAQFLGIFTGTLAMVFGFYLLVPDATVLTGTADQAAKFPAPAAQAWKAVAEVFKVGLDNMHPMHQKAIFWGLGIGTLLLAIEKIAERIKPAAKKFMPSATGLGLGLILPFQYPLSMLIGAIVAALWTAKWKKSSDSYLVPVAAGVIAGVSIMGVISALLNQFLFA